MDIEQIIGKCHDAFPTTEGSCCLVVGDACPDNLSSRAVSAKEATLFVAEAAGQLSQDGNNSCGVVCIGWGASRAAVMTSNGPELIQWQEGYQQVDEWVPESPRTALDQPSGMAYIRSFVEERWYQYLRVLGNRLTSRMDPSKAEKVVLIAVPPLPVSFPLEDLDALIDSPGLRLGDRAIICDVGKSLIESLAENGQLPVNNVRHYVVLVDAIISVMAYDCSSMENIRPIGGFGMEPGKSPIEFASIHNQCRVFSSTEHSNREDTIDRSLVLVPSASPMWGTPARLRDLLARLPATFAHEMWSLANSPLQESLEPDRPKPQRISRALTILAARGACTTDELLRGEHGSKKTPVSLADAAQMFDALCLDPRFRRSLPMRCEEEPLGGIQLPLVLLSSDLEALPTNHIDRIWKPVRPSGYVGSYLEAWAFSLNRLTQIITEHFDECTTLVMAEELVASGFQPSAHFTASLFLYLLCRNPRVRLVS